MGEIITGQATGETQADCSSKSARFVKFTRATLTRAEEPARQQEAKMKTEHQPEAITIVGLELRTNNEEAFQTIPMHWHRFGTEGILEQIPNKASTDVYAIYTHYEYEGLNNNGMYSLVIGAAVTHLEPVPSGLTRIQLPASGYQVFSVQQGRPDLVGEAWQTIWQQDISGRTFIADGERYRSDGTIDILLGVKS
jgi:predicted transcriptional regulator YdeE